MTNRASSFPLSAAGETESESEKATKEVRCVVSKGNKH